MDLDYLWEFFRAYLFQPPGPPQDVIAVAVREEYIAAEELAAGIFQFPAAAVVALPTEPLVIPQPTSEVVFLYDVAEQIHNNYPAAQAQAIYEQAMELRFVRNQEYDGLLVGHLDIEHPLHMCGEVYVLRDQILADQFFTLTGFFDERNHRIVISGWLPSWNLLPVDLDGFGVSFYQYLNLNA